MNTQKKLSNDEREISKLLSSLVDQVIEDEISNINELYLNNILSNQMIFNTTDFSQLPSKLYKFYIQNIQLDTMSIKKIFNKLSHNHLINFGMIKEGLGFQQALKHIK